MKINNNITEKDLKTIKNITESIKEIENLLYNNDYNSSGFYVIEEIIENYMYNKYIPMSLKEIDDILSVAILTYKINKNYYVLDRLKENLEYMMSTKSLSLDIEYNINFEHDTYCMIIDLSDYDIKSDVVLISHDGVWTHEEDQFYDIIDKKIFIYNKDRQNERNTCPIIDEGETFSINFEVYNNKNLKESEKNILIMDNEVNF